MPTYSSSLRRRLWLAPQAAGAFRTIPNTSGTWTTTGAQVIPFSDATFTPGNPVNDQPFITGNASTIAGVRGRNTGGINISAPVIPSGSAGVVPNLNLLLQAAFGAAPAIVATTSVTYNFVDALLPFLALAYDESGSTTLTKMYSMGTLPKTLTFQLNGNFLTMTADCGCIGVGDSDNFPAYAGTPDAVLAGGLSVFPVEPGSPTTAGHTVTGFGGTVTVDGQTIGELRSSCTVVVDPGYEYIGDVITDPYALTAINGPRKMTLGDFTVLNSDSAALINLKQKAFNKTPMNVSIAITNGGVGSTVTFNLNQVQFPQGAFTTNGSAIDVKFGGAAAHATTGNTNDGTIVFT
jgi:hypothetical protein